MYTSINNENTLTDPKFSIGKISRGSVRMGDFTLLFDLFVQNMHEINTFLPAKRVMFHVL